MAIPEFMGTKVTWPSYVPPSTAWLEHGPFAMWLVRRMKPKRIVELGTYFGYSYFSMCEAVLEEGLQTECIAIDTWRGDEHGGFYDDSVYQTVVQHNTRYKHFSRLLRKTFREATSDVDDGSVDLLHIDGRHYYEDVRIDFETWKPKLSRTSLVLFHDTMVRERNFGVHRYWIEVSKNRPSINFHHCHGLGVLFFGEDVSMELLDVLHMQSDRNLTNNIIDFFEQL